MVCLSVFSVWSICALQSVTAAGHRDNYRHLASMLCHHTACLCARQHHAVLPFPQPHDSDGPMLWYFQYFFPPLSNKWFKTHHPESYSGTVACSFWWYFNKCDLNQRDTDCDYFFIFSGIILRGQCTWITSKNIKSYISSAAKNEWLSLATSAWMCTFSHQGNAPYTWFHVYWEPSPHEFLSEKFRPKQLEGKHNTVCL